MHDFDTLEPSEDYAPMALDHVGVFLWNVHSHLQASIRFADAKAGVLVGFASAALYFLHGQGKVTALQQGDLQTILAFTFLAVTLLLSTLAIQARLFSASAKQSPPPADGKPFEHLGVVFWEDILLHDSADRYAAHMLHGTAGKHLDVHLARQIYQVARICSRKYRLLKVASYALLAGGIAAALALLN